MSSVQRVHNPGTIPLTLVESGFLTEEGGAGKKGSKFLQKEPFAGAVGFGYDVFGAFHSDLEIGFEFFQKDFSGLLSNFDDLRQSGEFRHAGMVIDWGSLLKPYGE